MKQVTLATAMILMALLSDSRPVSSSPLSASIRQPAEKRPPSDRSEALGGQPPSSNTQLAGNPSQIYQPMPAGGMSSSSRPSSQMSDTRHSMQPKDSYADPKSSGPPNRQDFIHTNHDESARGRHHNNSHASPMYVRPESSIEGSGSGPPPQNHRPKMDDTEDSGDDEEDKDDDYDYGDTLEGGSGHGQIASTTQSPSSIGRLQSVDSHSPFRQPINMPDLRQTVSTVSSTKLIITTRVPARMSQTTPTTFVPPSTTSASMSTPRQTTTSSKNLAVNNKNRTNGEVDYDYDDGDDDDDSEDSPVFEDNDPLELGFSRPNSTSQPGPTTNPDMVESKKRLSTTRTPSYVFSDFINQTPPSSLSVGISTIPPKRHTTPAPATQQMTTKPATMKPTAPQVLKPNSRPGVEGDPNAEEDRRALEDDEDDDDEQDDDDQKDDMEDDSQDDDDPQRVTRPSNSSTSSHKPTKPNQSSRPVSSGVKPTNPSIQPSSRPKVSPSQEKSTELQMSSTTSKPNVIIPSNPTTQLPVPILPIATTTVTPTTPKLPVVNFSPKPTTSVEVTTPKTTSFVQPTRSSTTSSSTTFRPTLSFATEKPATRFTTSMNTQASNNRSPQSKVTASITQYENGDTLTRQMYEKAVEVYQEADRTVRAAWQAIWPPDINLESSVMEPLLNQPLFFMLALGGTVICLVLLFLLVVYIITYQIQPKDDDSSIY